MPNDASLKSADNVEWVIPGYKSKGMFEGRTNLIRRTLQSTKVISRSTRLHPTNGLAM